MMSHKTILREYIEEKSILYLGDNIGEKTIDHIIEWQLKRFQEYKIPIAPCSTKEGGFSSLLLKIGNDEIFKFKDESYIVGDKIIGLHPNLSKSVILYIDDFLNTQFFKYKFRELRLYEIRQKTIINEK